MVSWTNGKEWYGADPASKRRFCSDNPSAEDDEAKGQARKFYQNRAMFPIYLYIATYRPQANST